MAVAERQGSTSKATGVALSDPIGLIRVRADVSFAAGYTSSNESAGQVYGWCALAVGAFLLWYAAWTIECNVLVLAGARYKWFLWAPVLPTLLLALTWRFRYAVVAAYSPQAEQAAASVQFGRPPALGSHTLVLLCGSVLIAFVAAHLGNLRPTAVPYIVACLVVSAIIGALTRHKAMFAAVPLEIGWRLPATIVLLALIYYFTHRFDGDDANFVNLAIGAQRTHGAVYELDTMLGDGPNPIHLPTYKFHSFELLAAVVSTFTGLEPVGVLHLLLPALLIPLIALTLLLTLAPAVGRFWFAAALLWLAFLFVNSASIAGWGIHGIVRLQQGKGFLVSALLPLMAALAARWFRRGQRSDLLAMLLTAICSVGFSANGIYAAPLAAAFVGVAFVASDVRSALIWTRALLLTSTFLYSAFIALVIFLFHLALPSEQLTPTFAIDQLNRMAASGVLERLTLTAMALSPLGLLQYRRAGVPALVYFATAMLLTLNPWSWVLISASTGNLGFRVFWSVPVAGLMALLGIAGLRSVGCRSEGVLTAISAACLGASIVLVANHRDPLTTIAWHSPGLKVVDSDYKRALRLAARTQAGCRVLSPSKYAMLLSLTRDAPHPVFVSSLYQTHYRFTMPAAELALRNRLRMVVEGTAPSEPPTPSELQTAGIPIGTIAVAENAASRMAAAKLASELKLAGPVRDGELMIWRGNCLN